MLNCFVMLCLFGPLPVVCCCLLWCVVVCCVRFCFVACGVCFIVVWCGGSCVCVVYVGLSCFVI